MRFPTLFTLNIPIPLYSYITLWVTSDRYRVMKVLR